MANCEMLVSPERECAVLLDSTTVWPGLAFQSMAPLPRHASTYVRPEEWSKSESCEIMSSLPPLYLLPSVFLVGIAMIV